MKNDLKNLTLDEKITLLTGKDAWNIHEIEKLDKFNMADGPNGLRKVAYWADGKEIEVRSIAYPCGHVLANSWSKETVKAASSSMADDCIDEEVDMLLAPAVNIKRDPRCGRNFEYLSEDPFLAGTLGKVYIDGLQEKGIGTSLKHYCCNNAEDNRQSCNNIVDKRTLMEIYTRNFYYALKADPTTVMCAYNKVNGEWCSANKEINDILYNKLGFKNAIVSDWGAVHDKVKSVKSGLALQMPHSDTAFADAKKGYESGELTEAEIDLCAGRTIDLINRMQEMKKLRKIDRTLAQRERVALEGAMEGAVLLKNNGVLPMKKGKTVAYTGIFEPDMYHGGGSGNSKANREPVSMKVALKNADPNVNVLTFGSIIHRAWHGNVSFWWSAADEILPVFKDADYVILQVGNWHDIESEGYDRHTLRLNDTQEAFIRFMGDHFKGKTIVQLIAGSAIDVTPWIDHVDALILTGFAGQYMNDAAAYLMYGDVCPSGKLAETFPKKLEDISCLNAYNSYMTENYYNDGIYVGYRHYDKHNIEPMYEFGYGLSYTKFEYSDLKVEDKGETLEVTYKIKNVGDYDGKEVSEIYSTAPAKVIDRPVKELVGYSKDLILKGETKTIKVTVDKEAMTYFDVAKDDFVLEKGEYTISVGASSRDIRLTAKIIL